MQDRLKYRFWHKPTKKMIDCYGYNEDFVFGDVLDGIGTTYSIAEFEDCILMQCTGLKDKNGKLIYEGDIIKCYYMNSDTDKLEYDLMRMVYKDEACAFGLVGLKTANFEDFVYSEFISEEYEIVGNIYENPELLEGNYGN